MVSMPSLCPLPRPHLPTSPRRSRSPAATLALLLSAAIVGLSISVGTPARADNEFDVTVAQGVVTVTAHSGWHINKEFPWKLTMGDTKLDKSKFNLAETTASIQAPAGTGKLKGAVCSKDQCHTFEKEVSVKN